MTSFVSHPALRHYWWAVARSDDLGATPMRAEPLGQAVVVWRAAGGVRAAVDRCPHRDGPLSAGTVDDGCLVCPYHGWRFAPDGTCTRVPSQRPDLAISARAVLESVLATERYGLVWVCLDEPWAGVVDIPEADDAAFRVINCPGYRWDVSATRLADNFLDSSHFPFVHQPSFGAATDPELGPVEVEATDDRVAYRHPFVAANPAFAQATTGQAVATVTRQMSFSITLPLTLVNRVEYETGLRHVILNAITPVTDTTTQWFMTLIRNDDHSVPPMDAVALDRQIVDEDRRMLELIGGTLPLELPALVHVAADRPSVEWIRRLRRLLGLDG